MRVRTTTIMIGFAAVLAGCTTTVPEMIAQVNPFEGLAEDRNTQQATRVQGSEEVAVNRYLWAASLEVLSFLPVQSVDPFTGVITTGFGAPPGGGTAYRATVHVRDPALAARALNVALFTRSGVANPATVQAVEDAILSRARQLRVADGAL